MVRVALAFYIASLLLITSTAMAQTLRPPEPRLNAALKPLTDDASIARLNKSLPLMKSGRLNLFAEVVAACMAFGDTAIGNEPCDVKSREYLVKYSDDDDKGIISGLSAAFNQKKGSVSEQAKFASDALVSFYKAVGPEIKAAFRNQ